MNATDQFSTLQIKFPTLKANNMKVFYHNFNAVPASPVFNAPVEYAPSEFCHDVNFLVMHLTDNCIASKNCIFVISIPVMGN